MSYIRTPEIRAKQSAKMKGRPSPLKGIKRPGKGGRPRRTKRIHQICITCGKQFEKLITNPKKFCCRPCYMESKKGVRWYFGTQDKSYMKTEEYLNTIRKPSTPAFVRYKNTVHRLSHKVYRENKKDLNPNDYPLTLAGIDGGYQLDHIFTVREGFDQNIPAEIVAKKENLRVIPWKQNLERNRHGYSL